ncbi:MAG: hypothetical protein PHV16_04410 [Candidatus Nanoarchaeia archaeon]|nr:hypothetical protein [Candidatus Nanoarchaeia archaeon]
MVEYRIVKYCRLCKKRFLVNKGESKKNYCDECQLRLEKEREKEEDEIQ